MKVGEYVSKIDIVKKVINKNGGIAKTADFVTSGLSTYDVADLCKKGFIERIRHGFYQLPNTNDTTEEKILAALLPEGIVCVESALFYYGYSDFTPRLWTIAVPRTISRTKLKIEAVPLRAYYIQKQYFNLGKETVDFNGVNLLIYDRERTICDCFKYRTKLDSELFNKVINAYAADDKKNLANLSKYAKEMGLYKKVTELMEVMLNG
jgi:predicted transcriptional regulator of viral defense system